MSLRPEDPPTIGGYALRGRLGQGGQGAVFLGAGGSGEQVAIKWLHPHLTDDVVAAERFAREVAVAERVAPFCTAKVIATGVQSGRPYIVSEYVEGPSLHQVVRDQGPRTGSSLHRLVVGTATALAAIHQAGIVHRDFSPSNVLLASDGPRVIDFGIARALEGTSTITSTPMGTPAYMAPEQVLGHPISAAADMFAWASTIVFAASGRPPFYADSVPAVINRVLNMEADLSMLDGDLRELVGACLAKDPARRPSAEQALMRMLRTPTAPVPGQWATPSGPVPYSSGPQASGPYTGGVLPGGPAPVWHGPSNPAPTEPPRRRGQTRAWVIAGVAAALAVIASVTAVVVATRDTVGTRVAASSTPSASAPPASTPAGSAEPTPSDTPTPVTTTGLAKTVLPNAKVTLYESPDDPVVLTAYSFQRKESEDWVDHVRVTLTGNEFKPYRNYMDARRSPNGRYLATRTETYTASDHDSVQFTDRKTGKVSVVETVKSPLQSVVEVWSPDSRRVLLNVGRNIKGTWTTTGFAIVTVGQKRAKIVTIKGLKKDVDFGWDAAGTGVVALTSSASTQPLQFFDVNGKRTRTVRNVGGAYAMALFSPSGRSFVTDCPGMSASDHCVFDTASGKETSRFASDCDVQEGWYDEHHLMCWGEDSRHFNVIDFNGDVVRVIADIPKGVGKNLTLYFARRSTS